MINNLLLSDRNRLMEVNDTLQASVRYSNELIENQKLEIDNLEKIVGINKGIYNEQDKFIQNQKKEIDVLNKELKKQLFQKKLIGYIAITTILTVLILK